MSLTILDPYAPSELSRALINELPFEITLDETAIAFERSGAGLSGSLGNLAASVELSVHPDHGALSWQLRLENRGSGTLGSIGITPFRLLLEADPAEALPRVRHMSGSWHYDACYPPRAFRVQEEAFMTHDHSKPLVIGGRSSEVHVPIVHFALDSGGALAGFFAGFEWSAGWEVRVGWRDDSFSGEARGPFLIEGDMELGDIELGPGEALALPRVHLGFFAGESWNDLENVQRRYFQSELVPGPAPDRTVLPVSYDHWFGIYLHFDLEDLKRQATKAAELGCEYFCLDGSWYLTEESFINGLGNWDTPHPRKFPGGREGVRELSDHVRSLGMRFGIWHLIQVAMPGTDAMTKRPELFRDSDERPAHLHRLKLETEEGVDYAYTTLKRMIDEWQVSWMRFESIPENGLRYNLGYNRLIDRLTAEHPELYIEICNGGGMRLDIGSIARTHGNWLSDHTTDPDVCRFMQTGALRFWPVDYLNMAVVAFRGRGGETATPHQLLSRMVGVLSFDGAIAEWDEEQTDMAKRLVDLYKEIRHYKHQPVFFPLPQPQRVEDWDAVVFGDGRGDRQLLFAFRTLGEESVRMQVPEARGTWRLLAASGTAALEEDGAGLTISLPARSAALWVR